jgi:rod shape determining protein RodA
VLLLAVLALVTIGSLLVWSATSHRDDLTMGDPAAYLKKQVVNICIGLVLLAVVTATDHRWVRILAPLAYLASVGRLVLVLTNGATINGSRSWISWAACPCSPRSSPSLAVVVGMALPRRERTEGPARAARARHGDRHAGDRRDPRVADHAQPDLGTCWCCRRRLRGARPWRGRRRRWLALLVAGWSPRPWPWSPAVSCKAYQVDRFLAFTNPDLDPRGAGYNTEQARIAVGNGGLFGQGLFDGSQTQSGFVPEQHTDFVFTVGGRGARPAGGGPDHRPARASSSGGPWTIAATTPDVFGRVAAAGIACWFGFQTFQNSRHVPGHHAGHRRAPAVRVVRRLVAVRRHARGRPAAEHRHPLARAVPRVQGDRRPDGRARLAPGRDTRSTGCPGRSASLQTTPKRQERRRTLGERRPVRARW